MPPREATLPGYCAFIQYWGQKRSRPKAASQGWAIIQGREERWPQGRLHFPDPAAAVCRSRRESGVEARRQGAPDTDKFLKNQPISIGTKRLASPRFTSSATLPFEPSTIFFSSSALFTGLPFTAVTRSPGRMPARIAGPLEASTT